MNNKTQKLNMLLIVVIALSFLVYWSSPLSPSLASDLSLDHRNKIISSSDTVLKIGTPLIALFTNESSSHAYVLRDLIQGQEVYFSINPDHDFNVTLYTPSRTIFEIERVIHETKYLGAWKPLVNGNWKIQVNHTRPIEIGNVSYSILVSIPQLG